jgi:hypothetical protein
LAEPVFYIKDGDGKRVLLVGRNRLDALEMLGRKIDINDSTMFVQLSNSIDAEAFIASKNIHRRHLTPEERRERLKQLLRMHPEKSDRQLAEVAKVDHKTLGAVRKEMVATGEHSPVEKTIGKDGRARRQPAGKPLEKSGDVETVSTRTDTEGRQQPARKPPKEPDALYLKVSREAATKAARALNKAKQPASNGKGATKIEMDEDAHLTCDGEYAVVDHTKPPKMRIEGFLFRARESARGARMDDMAGLVTQELIEAARDAASAWDKVHASLRQQRAKAQALASDLPRDRPDPGDRPAAEPTAESLQGKEGGQKQKKGKIKFTDVKSTVAESVSIAFGELQSLAEEAREIVDNASDGLRETQRIQSFEATADALEQYSSEEPDVEDAIGNLPVTYANWENSRKGRGLSRADRCAFACSVLGAIIDVLEMNDSVDGVAELRDAIEETMTECEYCEFPGMYG